MVEGLPPFFLLPLHLSFPLFASHKSPPPPLTFVPSKERGEMFIPGPQVKLRVLLFLLSLRSRGRGCGTKIKSSLSRLLSSFELLFPPPTYLLFTLSRSCHFSCSVYQLSLSSLSLRFSSVLSSSSSHPHHHRTRNHLAIVDCREDPFISVAAGWSHFVALKSNLFASSSHSFSSSFHLLSFCFLLSRTPHTFHLFVLVYLLLTPPPFFLSAFFFFSTLFAFIHFQSESGAIETFGKGEYTGLQGASHYHFSRPISLPSPPFSSPCGKIVAAGSMHSVVAFVEKESPWYPFAPLFSLLFFCRFFSICLPSSFSFFYSSFFHPISFPPMFFLISGKFLWNFGIPLIGRCWGMGNILLDR